MLAELMLLVSICAQDATPRDAVRPPNAPAAPAAAPVLPADASRDATPLTHEERIDQIDTLLDAFLASPSPSSWRGDIPPALMAGTQNTKNTLIVSLRTHARVTSDYVRLIDVAELDHDPEGLAAFVGTIVVCSAPDQERATVVARDKIAQRLEEYGLTFNRFLLVGAHQVLITRVKAAYEGTPQDKKPQPAPAAPCTPDAPAQPDPAPSGAEGNVKKGSPVTIVRKGSLFTSQESGNALSDGAAGQIVKVSDHRGRSFTAHVTGHGIVTIQGESTGKINE